VGFLFDGGMDGALEREIVGEGRMTHGKGKAAEMKRTSGWKTAVAAEKEASRAAPTKRRRAGRARGWWRDEAGVVGAGSPGAGRRLRVRRRARRRAPRPSGIR
jgi:hypothetical protein